MWVVRVSHSELESNWEVQGKLHSANILHSQPHYNCAQKYSIENIKNVFNIYRVIQIVIEIFLNVEV